MPGLRPPIFSIGHSTRSLIDFVELLKVGSVTMLVDIRATPWSRTNPQFNLDALPDALSAWQIGYALIEELGGRRPKSRTVPPEVNGFWTNQSFHNYADYALSDGFRRGLSRLEQVSADRRCAFMCSEAVWWRCHRRIVTDYLLKDGREVLHLMDPHRAVVASQTPSARPEGASIVYPVVK